MSEHREAIPFYKEINEFLASIPSEFRSKNPLFYCLRLKPHEGSISNYKPPFRKDFYFIGLVNNAGETKITYDQTNVTRLNSFLVFQSPGLIYSFYRDPSAGGYLVYFKKECFSFFKPDFESEFPYFNILHSNFYKLNEERFMEFAPRFEALFQSYERCSDHQHQAAAAQLLALLYELKTFTRAFRQWEDGFSSPQHQLTQKFVQLIHLHYTEKHGVEDYAVMLNVSANHLSQSIKSATGRNALSFISHRLMHEARSMIKYTGLDIAEIAYQLGFSDPAHFGKFFKKHSGLTPSEYRRQAVKVEQS